MNFEENKANETSNTTTNTTTRTPEEQEMFNLDVCFLLDSTGSMQASIDMARDKIKQFISDLKAQYSDSVVRIAIVAYRDHGDKDQYQVFSFNESVDAAHSFLAKLKASGGGDTPEDVNGGFRETLKLSWKSLTTKMIYHLADAPCHGKRFHDVDDSHPKGLKDDKPWEELLKNVYDMDINYLYYDIGGSTKKMYTEFKKIYDACGEKSHLIFSYEILGNPVPTYSSSLSSSSLSSYSGLKSTSMKKKASIKTSSISRGLKFDAPVKSSMKMEKLADEIPEFETINVVEKKSSDTDEKFIKSTVTNAMNQMMRNVSYQKARLNKA